MYININKKMKKGYNQFLTEQLTVISNLLKEEYSVSEKVKYDATCIVKKIKNGIAKERKNEMTISNEPRITFRQGTEYYMLYDKKLTIHFQCYNFEDSKAFADYRFKVPYRIKNQYNRKAHILDVSVDAVKGYIIPQTLYDTVQHELEHSFQEENIGSSFSDKPLYIIAKEFRKNSNTEAKKNVGEILYLTYQAEQDGFVNGLYALLKNNYEGSKIQTSYVFEMSDIYGVLERMAELQTYIVNNKDNKDLIEAIAELKKSSHIGYSRLITIIDDAIKRLRKKIARVIFKAQKDTNYYNDMEYVTYDRNHYNSIRQMVDDEINSIFTKN